MFPRLRVCNPLDSRTGSPLPFGAPAPDESPQQDRRTDDADRANPFSAESHSYEQCPSGFASQQHASP